MSDSFVNLITEPPAPPPPAQPAPPSSPYDLEALLYQFNELGLYGAMSSWGAPSPAVGRPMFSVCNHGTATYVRNTSSLLHNVAGVEAVSVWNSMPYSGGAAAWQRAMTAISRSVVLGCYHTDYQVGRTIRFVRANNTVVERTVKSLASATGLEVRYNCMVLPLGGGDLALMVLNEPLPADFQCVPTVPPLSIPNGTYGVSILGGAETHPDKIASVVELLPARRPTDELASSWFTPVASGDSGSPAFVQYDNRLALLWAIGTYGSAGPGPDAAGAGYAVWYYRSQINAAMAALAAQGMIPAGEQLDVLDLDGYLLE